MSKRLIVTSLILTLSIDVIAQIDSLSFAQFPQIETAVKFLQNPQVRKSPLVQKKAFLQKKGE